MAQKLFEAKFLVILLEDIPKFFLISLLYSFKNELKTLKILLMKHLKVIDILVYAEYREKVFVCN
jgi:hypothetical protein